MRNNWLNVLIEFADKHFCDFLLSSSLISPTIESKSLQHVCSTFACWRWAALLVRARFALQIFLTLIQEFFVYAFKLSNIHGFDSYEIIYRFSTYLTSFLANIVVVRFLCKLAFKNCCSFNFPHEKYRKRRFAWKF